MLHDAYVQLCFLFNANLVILMYARMTFEIDAFRYLYFWSASTNALIYWQLPCFYHAMRYPQRISQGHWAMECIQFLPRRGKWTEVSAELRHQVSGLSGYCPFTYRELVQFLEVAEHVLEELGRDARTRRDSARQMVRDLLLDPTETAALPTCNDPDPHRVRIVTTINSENKRTEFSLKLDYLQA